MEHEMVVDMSMSRPFWAAAIRLGRRQRLRSFCSASVFDDGAKGTADATAVKELRQWSPTARPM